MSRSSLGPEHMIAAGRGHAVVVVEQVLTAVVGLSSSLKVTIMMPVTMCWRFLTSPTPVTDGGGGGAGGGGGGGGLDVPAPS